MNDNFPDNRIKLESIEHALDVIDPIFLNSPQYNCEPLSERLGCNLTLKVEFANPIRCFKGRGASLLVSKMVAYKADGKRPFITASAGNWGQAVAYACRKEGVRSVVYAARNANPLKIERMKALGAEVRLYGDDFDAAKSKAIEVAKKEDWRMVADGVDIEASEGAGTIAVELMKSGIKYDQVVVPLGGGAMLVGMARWIKAVSPNTKIIGVCAEGASAMEQSWRTKSIIETPSVDTIADGIAVRAGIPDTIHDMDGLVDDVLLVDDVDMIDAMKQTYQCTGHIIEPSGTAGVAAIMKYSDMFQGQNVATVLCGNNITKEQALKWVL